MPSDDRADTAPYPLDNLVEACENLYSNLQEQEVDICECDQDYLCPYHVWMDTLDQAQGKRLRRSP